MRILLSLVICALILPCLSGKVFALDWPEFKASLVDIHPVYLVKTHKEAECHLTTGMLAMDQAKNTASALTKMYDNDYGWIEAAFNAAFASGIAMNSEESRAMTQAKTQTIAQDIVAKQKQENVERNLNSPQPCPPNPLGYVFTGSDAILEEYVGLLEMENRNLARGVTEDLEHADIAIGAASRNVDYSRTKTFEDEKSVATFRNIVPVLFGENKNPRPQSLKENGVQGSRYLTREAGLSVFRSVAGEPWREYQATRMRVIPFKLIRDWMEGLYLYASKTIDENLDAEPGTEEGGIAGPITDSNAALNKLPVMSAETCTQKGYATIENRCKPGDVVGKPRQELIKMTQKHPAVYSYVKKYCAKYGVPEDVMAALIGSESSGGESLAPNQYDAAGAGQQKPETMEDIARIYNRPDMKVTCKWVNEQCDPRKNVEKSIEAAVLYLKHTMKRNNGDILGAVFDYNQGPGNANCLRERGVMCRQRGWPNGKPLNCEGTMYTQNIMCIPATAFLEGVTLKLPDDYQGEPIRDEGQPVLPELAEGEAPMRTDVHVLTEEEYKRQLSAMPLWNDLTMLSQEETYDYLAQFFMSDVYNNLVGPLNAAGVLKMRFPVQTMKYRLWDQVRKEMQLGNVLDMLADIPEYQDSLKQVSALSDRRGGR